MNLTNQRRMAADILKCGVHRVYIDPDRNEDVFEAVTRGDIRSLINSGAITKLQKKGVSRGRARVRDEQRRKGKRSGQGRRKGTAYARYPRKRQWIDTIRPIRRELRSLRDEGFIDRSVYRTYFRRSKGGMYRNIGHMVSQMRSEDVFAKSLPQDWVESRKLQVRNAQQDAKPSPEEAKKSAVKKKTAAKTKASDSKITKSSARKSKPKKDTKTSKAKGGK